MMLDAPLAIVTVNFGDPADTLALIRSLAQSDIPIAVYVVDNPSTAAYFHTLVAELRAEERGDSWQFTQGCILRAPVNLGFAGGNNLGIEASLRGQHDYIWLLNNDTEVTSGTLRSIRDVLARPPADIIGATLVHTATGTTQCLAGSSFNELLATGTHLAAGLPSGAAEAVPPADITAKLDYVSGASMLIRRQVLETIGLLEGRFFLYYEEIDFCRRATQAGFTLGWSPALTILHKEGASINGAAYSSERSLLSEYHAMRSSVIFLRKWHPRSALLRIPLRLIAKLVLNARRGRWPHVVASIRGAVNGCFG